MLTVVITRRTKDRHGDTVSENLRTVEAYGFAPTSSSVSETEKHEQVDRRGALYFPADTLDGLPAGVLYEFDGARWGADDAGADWVFPWGDWRPGIEVRVKRVSG